MALPKTGTIKLTDIQQEFGAPLGSKLSEFLAGGSYVPAGKVNWSGISIPSVLPIEIYDFIGVNQIKLEDFSITDFDFGYTNAELRFEPTGEVKTRSNQGAGIFYTKLDMWSASAPNEIGSNFSLYAQVVSGYTPIGQYNSWISLGSQINYSLASSATKVSIYKDSTINFKIRRNSDSKILAEANITLHAWSKPTNPL